MQVDRGVSNSGGKTLAMVARLKASWQCSMEGNSCLQGEMTWSITLPILNEVAVDWIGFELSMLLDD